MKKETLSSVIQFNKLNLTCGRSKHGYGMTHFAAKDFKPGEVVFKAFGEIITHQTGHISIQIGLEHHCIPKKWTGKYLNHSCKPTCYVVTRDDGFPNLVANRFIAAGEEITYSYFMTEYLWTHDAAERTIWCRCGTKKKPHHIPSFSLLSHKEKLANKKYLSRYLQDLCNDL